MDHLEYIPHETEVEMDICKLLGDIDRLSKNITKTDVVVHEEYLKEAKVKLEAILGGLRV